MRNRVPTSNLQGLHVPVNHGAVVDDAGQRHLLIDEGFEVVELCLGHVRKLTQDVQRWSGKNGCDDGWVVGLRLEVLVHHLALSALGRAFEGNPRFPLLLKNCFLYPFFLKMCFFTPSS